MLSTPLSALDWLFGMGVLATATDGKLWNVVLTVVLYLHDYA